MPAMTESYYTDEELRYTRWLERFQLDRSRHAKARRTHPDPAALDAELADILNRKRGLSCGKPELREATGFLRRGARMVETSRGLLCHKLAGIIDLLEAEEPDRDRRTELFLDPHFRAFLDALTASGSVAILDSWSYYKVGPRDAWEQLPFCVLQPVVIGEPWGIDYDPKAVKLGSLQDLALRRVCLRLLARMAFLSAERALGSGDTHPFMALLETDRRKLCPFGSMEMGHLVHPTNQAAFFRVVYLMRFVYRRFPWTGRPQHLTDAEHASTVLSRPRGFYWGVSPRELAAQCFRQCDPMPPAEKMMLLAILVPGSWKYFVEEDLGHLLTAYCFVGRLNQRRMGDAHGNTLDGVQSTAFGKAIFSSRRNEQKLITMLRDNGHVSSWICGAGLLLDICRQRRRRVLQAVAKGSPHAFAAAAPHLLAFVRGPSVRGKKERLAAWLESKLKDKDPSSGSLR